MRITSAHVLIAVIGLAMQFLLTISVRDVVALQTRLGDAVSALAGTGGRAMEVHWIHVQDIDGDGTLTWREVASSVAKEAAAAAAITQRLVSNQRPAEGAAASSVQAEGRTRAETEPVPVDGLTPQRAVQILQSSLARRDFPRAYKAWTRLLGAAAGNAEADRLQRQTAARWVADLSAVLETAEPGSSLSSEKVSDACQSLAVFARTAEAEAALLSALRREIAPAEAALSELWSRSGAKRVDGMLRRGTAQMAVGRYEMALRTFNELIEAASHFPEGWNRRAALKYATGDYTGSLHDCARALELSPSHFGALNTAGLVHIALWQARQPRAGLSGEEAAAHFGVGARGVAGNWAVGGELGDRVASTMGEGESAAWATGEVREVADDGEREGSAGRVDLAGAGMATGADPALGVGGAGMGAGAADGTHELEEALRYFDRALAVHPKMEGAHDSARAARALLEEMGIRDVADGIGAVG
jgi:tetratricopeptide (TPR) repeat protein